MHIPQDGSKLPEYSIIFRGSTNRDFGLPLKESQHWPYNTGSRFHSSSVLSINVDPHRETHTPINAQQYKVPPVQYLVVHKRVMDCTDLSYSHENFTSTQINLTRRTRHVYTPLQSADYIFIE